MLKTKSCLAILTLFCLTGSLSVQAQTYTPSNRAPVTDTTLGTQVTGSNNNFNITGGLTTGQTTFHSFTDFSVPTNGQVNFTNPVGNRDIITRVTGNSFSDINGIVNTNGANFFLINPNGITFGTGAQLNVGRAFVGSTANGINLVDGGGRTFTFGTNQSGDALLKVAPNVLFNVASLNIGTGSGAINNFGTLQTTNNSQYIGLIGGNVNVNGGKIVAPGGRVDIGGLNTPGTVSVNSDGLVFNSTIPLRSDVTITNGSSVSVRANQTLNPVDPVFFPTATSPGSSINISANRIEVSKSGERFKSVAGDGQINQALGGLDGGLEVNSGAKAGTIGNISLNATSDILIQRAALFNLVRSGAQGSQNPGGGIKIVGNNITVTDKSEISADLYGSGRGGDVDIKALGNFSLVEPSPTDIIDRPQFAESVIAASTYGVGNSGKVTIAAGGNAVVSDRNTIASTVEANGIGDSSGIKIEAGTLQVLNGGEILTQAASSTTNERGDAGDIDITTTGDITISGSKNPGAFRDRNDAYKPLSSIASSSFRSGNAGKVTVTTPGKLTVTNRAGIRSQILENGNGDSGGINISAGELILANFSQISSSLGTYGQSTTANPKGTAGDIKIATTGNITLNEDSSLDPIIFKLVENDFSPSIIFSSVFGTGKGGKITIETPGKISIGNRDTIASNVEPSGQGDSAGINIKAGELLLFNEGQILSFATGISTKTGNAGDIDIKTTGNITIYGKNTPAEADAILASGQANSKSLSKISSSSFRQGAAGNISIDAGGTISLLNRGGITSAGDVALTGNSAGDITISSKQLTLDRGDISLAAKNTSANLKIATQNSISMVNGSSIITNNANGAAGNITISSPLMTLDTSTIEAQSQGGSGGNINIFGNDLLLLRRQSRISTNALSTPQADGNGGNIDINTILLVALLNEDSNITANATQGAGGKVNIKAQGVFGIEFSEQLRTGISDITATSEAPGRTGTVNVNTPGIDPGKNTTELPAVPTDPSTQISQVCGASNRQNKLTVTGRGGLPPVANDPLTGDEIWQDERATNSTSSAKNVTTPIKLAPPAIGLIYDGKGRVTLVAAGAQQQPIGTSTACPATKPQK
ncbi:filamentous hemagglutinin N-terminal domain-containing protein [Chamaesiphon sp. OTE_75_metabat_556]|uniref:two-partner secretion domain-containing protein n=1 Tax=Chamaesiphon sp. OTE_75_metabat_556 TaxID=2964692 RepID=UPI00286A23DD|nr:filamentous hemagglutinin N-terminal domain-containing protein [Chamaesiphon sp. OTE_75_metabat_556]